MSTPRRVVGSVVRPNARPVGEPVRTRWDEVGETTAPAVLDDLADVDAPAVGPPATPAVLVRGVDGVYRPVGLDEVVPAQRGSVVHYLEANPDAVPGDALVGDFVTVIAGERAGSVYHVEES